jgi:DNA-binding transcriptional MerR regulator
MGKTGAQEKFLSEEKQYYTIGETSEIVGVKPFVLRFWETEFPSIRPSKTRGNRRLYRRTDVERLLAIKNLLYDQKFTIQGAKKKLSEQEKTHQLDLSFLKYHPEDLVVEVRKGLVEALEILEKLKK